MKEKIIIPHVPVLDAIDVYSNSIILEKEATRIPVMTRNWPEEYPYIPITCADIAYSNRGIYVRFFSRGKGLRCQVLEDGGPVYTDSCVEFFLQKSEDERYYNFEFNCCGVCDASYRVSRSESTPFIADQYRMIARASTQRLQEIDNGTSITEFEVSIMIPFSILGYSSLDDLPDHILANFYKCGDKTVIPHFASWAPIDTLTPDFHRPEFFKPIYFGPRK